MKTLDPEGTFRAIDRDGSEPKQHAIGTYRECERIWATHPGILIQVCVDLGPRTKGWVSLR